MAVLGHGLTAPVSLNGANVALLCQCRFGSLQCGTISVSAMMRRMRLDNDGDMGGVLTRSRVVSLPGGCGDAGPVL